MALSRNFVSPPMAEFLLQLKVLSPTPQAMQKSKLHLHGLIDMILQIAKCGGIERLDSILLWL
jgi:hypothetical protein